MFSFGLSSHSLGALNSYQNVDSFTANEVAIHRGEARYCTVPPFHPTVRYPEYRFVDIESVEPNYAYEGVRELFRMLRYDEGGFSTPNWNPLRNIVKPGDTVVLKPNWIRESHQHRLDEWEQIITHPSLIRAVADYVFLALQGRGRVIAADGPQTDSDFEMIQMRCGLRSLAQFYAERDCNFEIMDLRRDRWLVEGEVTKQRIKLPGDPAGYCEVDLAQASEFASYQLNGNFYGADYDVADTKRFHTNGHHTYRLCATPMGADVLINLPKMKTHKKTGVTLSLKNLVGINGYRNCLPHHTIGTPSSGGDEFPTSTVRATIQSEAIQLFKKAITASGGIGGRSARFVKTMGRLTFGSTPTVVRSGNWFGNDTAWRMVLDLNKVLFNFDTNGSSRQRPRRYLSIVDGIVAGEGDGPVAASRVSAGLLVAGANPLAVDTVAATLMGFDHLQIPMLNRGWQIDQLKLAGFSPEQIVCSSNFKAWSGSFDSLCQTDKLAFRPHFGWAGHIERDLNGAVLNDL